MPKAMGRLHVQWLPQHGCVDHGGWAVFKANGHLFMIAAEKGRNPRVLNQLQAVCQCWNLWAPVAAPKLLDAA